MKNKLNLAVIYVLTFLSLNVFSQNLFSYVPGCANPVEINDSLYVNRPSSRHALDMLDARCAWTITRGDPNIIVAVIDTEFAVEHEDLTNTFVNTSGLANTHPSVNHGTSVSSCVTTGTNNNIGIAGIGYNTRIRGYREAGFTIWDNISQAYRDGARIINVSWDRISAIRDSAQMLIDNGVVLTVPAGNTPNANFHQSYADIDGVINVGGVHASNKYWDLHPNHLDYRGHARNTWVDVCALSWRVATCLRYGPKYTNTDSNIDMYVAEGTSLAAPQVAGVAALMRAVNPNLSPAEIENIIKATAVPIADAHLFPGMLGAGRVNAFRALRQTLCTLPSNGTTFSGTITTPDSIVNGNRVNIVNNTTVRSGNLLRVNACNEITINGNFTVEPGASLYINVYGSQ